MVVALPILGGGSPMRFGFGSFGSWSSALRVGALGLVMACSGLTGCSDGKADLEGRDDDPAASPTGGDSGDAGTRPEEDAGGTSTGGPSSDPTSPPEIPPSSPLVEGLSDKAATALTRVVFANLKSLRHESGDAASRRLVFGQQESDTSNRKANGLAVVASDVEAVSGKIPALTSYELYSAYPGSTTMFDTAGLAAGLPKLKELVADKYAKGVLASLVWHMRCPKASPSDGDRFSPADCPADYRLEELLSKRKDGKAGAHFTEWRAVLGVLADFFLSLKDTKGEPIPVQFRPFHEFTGNWFWWGRTNDAATWQAAWRELVDYMRSRGVHNVLWVFCPDKPTDSYQVGQGGNFEAYYPGDGYVDVVGFDRYDDGKGAFASGFAADLKKIAAFTGAHAKVAAVTEVGLNFANLGTNNYATWFGSAMFAPLTSTAEGRAFSYVALWRNAPWEKYMAESTDGALADGFRKMAASPALLFGDAKRSLYVRLAGGPSS
jgi:mannan endo-1,4-beta-mannosidase